MIITIFILPIIMVVAGYLMYKHPPKKVNWVIGYRTRASMKNDAAWKEANQSCGKAWMKSGLIMILVACLLYALFYFEIFIFSETALEIIVFCEIIPIVLPIIDVEKRIKKY